MKKNLLLYSIYLIVFIYGCSREESMLQFQDKSYSLKNGSVINKFIIVLNYDNSIENLTIPLKNENVKARADELLKKHGILASVDQVYSTAIQGFSVKLAPGQIDKLSLDKNVKMMQADKIIYLPERTKLNSTEISPSEITQEIPWGINRVGGPQNYTGTNVVGYWILV